MLEIAALQKLEISQKNLSDRGKKILRKAL